MDTNQICRHVQKIQKIRRRKKEVRRGKPGTYLLENSIFTSDAESSRRSADDARLASAVVRLVDEMSLISVTAHERLRRPPPRSAGDRATTLSVLVAAYFLETGFAVRHPSEPSTLCLVVHESMALAIRCKFSFHAGRMMDGLVSHCGVLRRPLAKSSDLQLECRRCFLSSPSCSLGAASRNEKRKQWLPVRASRPATML